MKKLILIPLAMLALIGCQSVQDRAATLPVGTPQAVIVKTVIDDKIAVISSNLASQCLLTKIAVTGAALFAKTPSQARWVDNIRISVNNFCSAPPSDVEGTLLALQRIYREINTRVPETQAYVTAEWARLGR